MRRWLALAWLALAGAAAAQTPQDAAPVAAPRGEAKAASALSDREFGVRSEALGLQRRVEMYQWRREGADYATTWAPEPIDSSGFDGAHANPGKFPVQTRFWVASSVVLDGNPVHEDVLKEYGDWRAFRPGFSALPGNLAATFQPEGDGLSSSENPLDPQVGDLRITWHALTLPPLAGKVALEGGTWVPSREAAGSHAAAAQVADAPDAAASPADGGVKPLVWIAVAVAAVLAFFGLLSRRRRGRSRR